MKDTAYFISNTLRKVCGGLMPCEVAQFAGYCDGVMKAIATARQAAERDAINTPIQGSAADLIKIAMVKVVRAIKEAGLRAEMVLQIHDELVFDVPAGEVEAVKDIVRREMTTAYDFGVPLDVGIGVGQNWLDAH